MNNIYFFKIGSNSHKNPTIARILADGFPDCEVRVVDVRDDVVLKTPRKEVRTLFDVTSNSRNLKIRSRAVYDMIREWVSKNVDPKTTRFVFQTQSLFDSRNPDVPYFVYTDHTYLANRNYPSPWNRLNETEEWEHRERSFYRKVTRIFTTSNFARESLIKDYAVEPRRVQCVYSGANAAGSRELRPKTEFGKRILFVGYDWERKGGPVLMEAFDHVVRAIPDAELWIVGCAPEVKNPRCKVFGKLSLKETAKRFEAADLFSLPSFKDPAAIVLGEAAAYGLPIVATNVGGSPDRVLEGETGYLVSAGDSETLAKRLITLLSDVEKCKLFSRNAVQLAQERFSWSAVAKKLLSGIKEELGAVNLDAELAETDRLK